MKNVISCILLLHLKRKGYTISLMAFSCVLDRCQARMQYVTMSLFNRDTNVWIVIYGFVVCLETVVSSLDMTVSCLEMIVSCLDTTFLLDGNIQKRGCATTGFAGTFSPVIPVVAHPLRECCIVRSSLQKLVELCLKVALGDGTYVLAYDYAAL